MKTKKATTCAMAAVAMVAALAAATARADLTVTTKLGGTTKITTQLNGSALEAVIDGLQLAYNVISVIRGIASGDPFGVINGAIGAYNEALQLQASSGDKSAYGEATVSLDPNTLNSAQLTFRVVSNDDPLGAVRVGAPVLDGIRVHTPPREDFSDRGIGTDVSASVSLDLTRIHPGRYPFVFSTKETDCHQCLSVVHVVTVEVTRRCPQQGNCAQLRAAYDGARATWQARLGAVRSLAARASRNYVHQLTQSQVCVRTHRDPSACPFDAENGACPDLALGATASDCAGLRNALAAVEPARQRMEAAWSTGVSTQCCLFGCTGGRADLPWVTLNPSTRNRSAPGNN